MPAKQVNLLPKDTFEESSLGKFLKWAINFGRWVVVLTNLVVISAFLSRFYFDTKLADLQEEIKQKQAIIEATEEFENTFRKTQNRLSLVKTLYNLRFEGEKKVSFVTQILPPDVSLTTLSLNEDEINFSGTALSIEGIAGFLRNLISSPQIKGVRVSQFNIGSSGLGEPINFTISATWRKL